jgi:hypothetical protein
MIDTVSVNMFTGGALYPGAGDSLGIVGSTGMSEADIPPGPMPAPQGAGVMNPFQGNMLVGLLTFLVLVVLIMFLGHYMGRKLDGDGVKFANILPSAWSIFLITLVPVAGIPIWKALFATGARVGLPGFNHLSAYANAA